MSDSNSVSIIIPCYRQAHFLRQAIDSALSQQPEPEVIVVDDGSPDDAAEIASQHSKVVLIRQSNGGVAAARNAGARASSGQYLVFLDADDVLFPSAIGSALACFAAHPHCGFVYGQSESHTANSRSGPRPALAPGKDPYADLLHTRYIGMHGAIMFARHAFEAAHGYERRFSPCEDYALELAVARSFPVARHSSIVASHREHPGSASMNVGTMMRKALEVLDAQKPFVAGNEKRSTARQLGIRKVREHYINVLSRQPTLLTMRDIPSLVRYGPRILLRRIGRRASSGATFSA